MRSFHHPTCNFILLNRIWSFPWPSFFSHSLFFSPSLFPFSFKNSASPAFGFARWRALLLRPFDGHSGDLLLEGERRRPSLLRFCLLDLPCLLLYLAAVALYRRRN